MKLEDYIYADCNRLRTPSIDMADVDKLLETMLVNAWKNGNGAHVSIDSIAENDAVVAPLMAQVEKQLEYQRELALATTEHQAAGRTSAYEAQRQEQLQAVAAKVSEYEATKGGELKEVVKTLEARKGAYSATQLSLEEMRRSAQREMEKIGGAEGYKQLISIDSELSTGGQSYLKHDPAAAIVTKPETYIEPVQQGSEYIPPPTATSEPISLEQRLKNIERKPKGFWAKFKNLFRWY